MLRAGRRTWLLWVGDRLGVIKVKSYETGYYGNSIGHLTLSWIQEADRDAMSQGALSHCFDPGVAASRALPGTGA
jgi:hypothetical protein